MLPTLKVPETARRVPILTGQSEQSAKSVIPRAWDKNLEAVQSLAWLERNPARGYVLFVQMSTGPPAQYATKGAALQSPSLLQCIISPWAKWVRWVKWAKWAQWVKWVK